MDLIVNDCKEIIEKINFDYVKNKKVLVTGASGLIGIYLITCLKLLKKTHNIEIYAWVKNNLDKEISELFDGVILIKSDICETENFNRVPNFDVIIHSAGYGQPSKFMDNKIKTITLNTTATVQLLNKLNENGKFLFVSTSELYSGIESEKVSELQSGLTNTDHPRACYIESKRCGETICHAFQQNGVDCKIVRLSLAYGPGTKKNDGRVLNSLIEKGLTKKHIELMDNGDAIRTYCYISDVVKMFWNVLFFGKETTYNIGGDSKTSILNLANIIADRLDTKVIVPKTDNKLDGSPKIVNISIDKYVNEFGTPMFKSLELGLENTIKWQKIIYEKN